MPQISLRSCLLALANVLVIIACGVFSSGFFPYKPFIPGLAEYEDLPYGDPPDAPFDKVIFMVIDALRSDFVFSRTSGFSFTQSLVASGAAIPFTSYASAPTVTMPRIKALTTGSIPSFVDMILNIAESDTSSTLAGQDTWLAQMLRKPGGKAIMYGDDTWLKLFPNTFARADGTSSFFVSDFTEVDNNVTRHLPAELASSDWNVMIMHYLGMDHIGHKSGPRSHNMLPKQQEMDNIVSQVYEAIKSEPHLESTLFVLAGDHGMNDGGNHGGSAPGETSPALLFMSPKFSRFSDGVPCPTDPKVDFEYYEKIQQSDLAPTLAGLLGFPVPLNNLGIVLAPMLSMWPSDHDKMQLLLRNALQILNIVKAKFSHPVFEDSRSFVSCEGSLSDEHKLACAWKDAAILSMHLPMSSIDTGAAMTSLTKFCALAQNILSSTASNYNVTYLWTGVSLTTMAVLLCAWSCITRLGTKFSTGAMAFVGVGATYMGTMFASSFVEEEQQFWYWVTSAWISVQIFRRHGRHWKPAVAILVLLRIARRWNQSGQKYQGAPDIAKTMSSTAVFGPHIVWALIVLTYAEFARVMYSASFRASGYHKSVAITVTLLITAVSGVFKALFAASDEPELLGFALDRVLAYSLYAPSLIMLARTVFALLGASSILVILTRPQRVYHFPTFGRVYPILQHVLLLQIRTTSIPLLLILHTVIGLTPYLNLHDSGLALTSVAFAKFAYFSFGGTNAISSLDLSLSYNGIAAYDPVAVGALLLVSNFGTAMLASYAVIAGSTSRQGASREGSNKGRSILHKEKTASQRSYDVNKSITPTPARQTVGHHVEKVNVKEVTVSGSPYRGSDSILELDLMSLWISIETLAVMAGCTWLREHLFVWTVFSPRFLYAAAWLLGWHVVGTIGLGALSKFVG